MAPSLPKRKCISSKRQAKSSIDKINILKGTPNATRTNLTKPLAGFKKLPNVEHVNEVCKDKYMIKPTVLYLSPADKVNEYNPSTLVKPISSHLTLKKKISTRSHNISESLRNQTGVSHACDALSSVELINPTCETDHSKIPVFAADISHKEAEKMQDSSDKKMQMTSDKKIKSSRRQIILETHTGRCKKITVVPTCVKSPDVSINCSVSAERNVKKIPYLETPVKRKNILKSTTTKCITSKNVTTRKKKLNQDGDLKSLLSVSVKRNKASFITKYDDKKQKIRQNIRCQVCNFPKNMKNQHLNCVKCNSSLKKCTDLQSKQLLKKARHASKCKSKISSLSKCSVLKNDNKLKNNSVKICKKLKSVSLPKFRKKLNMQGSSYLPMYESVGVQIVKKKKCDKIPSKTKVVDKQHAFEIDSNASSKSDCFKIDSNNIKKKTVKVNLKIKSSKITKRDVKKCPSKIEVAKKHKVAHQAKKKGGTKGSPRITEKCSEVHVIKKSRKKASIQIAKCPSKVRDITKNILKGKNKVTKKHLRKRANKLIPDVSSEVDDSSKAFINQYASVTKKRKWDSVEDECEENCAKRNMTEQLNIKAKQQTLSKQVKREPSEVSCSDAVLNKLSDSQMLDCVKNPSLKCVENSIIESSVCSLETSLESKDNMLELATWNNFVGCSNDVSTPKEAEEMLGVSNEDIISFKCSVCVKTLSCTYCGFASHLYCHFNQESDEIHCSDSTVLKPLIESVVSLAFPAGNPQINSVVSLASQSSIDTDKPLSTSLIKSSSLLFCNILRKYLSAFCNLQKLLKPVLPKNCFYFEKDFKFKFDENFIFNKRFSHPNIIQDFYVYALEEKLKEPASQKPSSETSSSQTEAKQEVQVTTDKKLKESASQKPSSETSSSQTEAKQEVEVTTDNQMLRDTDDCNKLSVSQHEEINTEIIDCSPTNSANKQWQIDTKCNVEDKIYSPEILLETDNEHSSISISEHKRVDIETEGPNSADSVSKKAQIYSKSDIVINEHSSRKEEILSISSFNPKQIDVFSLYECKSNSEHTTKASSSNSDNNNVLRSEQNSHIFLPSKSTTEIINNVKDITFDIINVADINEEYCSVKETVPTTSCLISEKSETDIVPYSFDLNRGNVLLETTHISSTENAETTSAATSDDNTKLQVTNLPAAAKNDMTLPEVTSTLVEKEDLKKSLRFPVKAKGVKLSPLSSVCRNHSTIQTITGDIHFEDEQRLEAIHTYLWADDSRMFPTYTCCAICYATVKPDLVIGHLSKEHNIVASDPIKACFLPKYE